MREERNEIFDRRNIVKVTKVGVWPGKMLYMETYAALTAICKHPVYPFSSKHAPDTTGDGGVSVLLKIDWEPQNRGLVVSAVWRDGNKAKWRPLCSCCRLRLSVRAGAARDNAGLGNSVTVCCAVLRAAYDNWRGRPREGPYLRLSGPLIPRTLVDSS